ncbi:hypothetical protein JTB14_035068 [Gonioctena quinquepunctata]|nr:hypothetical protein JTB14_035068 [Gonioctena quinquepunctata]
MVMLIRPKKPVFAKADEHRYAKCLTMPKNRTNAMFYITRAKLRNMRYNTYQLTEQDEHLMKMIIANKFRNDTEEENFFYIRKSEGKKAILVDDLVMEKMERILTIVLTEIDDSGEEMYMSLLKNNIMTFEKIVNNLSVILNILVGIQVDVGE